MSSSRSHELMQQACDRLRTIIFSYGGHRRKSSDVEVRNALNLVLSLLEQAKLVEDFQQGSLVSEWFPIETALRNNKAILAWNGKNIHSARFDLVENVFVSTIGMTTKKIAFPTKLISWQPMPAPPEAPPL